MKVTTKSYHRTFDISKDKPVIIKTGQRDKSQDAPEEGPFDVSIDFFPKNLKIKNWENKDNEKIEAQINPLFDQKGEDVILSNTFELESSELFEINNHIITSLKITTDLEDGTHRVRLNLW